MNRTGRFAGAAVLAAMTFIMPLQAQETARVEGPVWNSEDRLERPADYRQWVYLSSGFDMTYGPAREANAGTPMFTNVFVLPAAHEVFTETGQWPDGTMFALEVRSPSEVSDNTEVHGRFQRNLAALEVSVKDSSRFEDGWGFYDFSGSKQVSEMFPYSASCYACHSTNAAVDYTFVQFYPTLTSIAMEKGVFTDTGFE